MAGKREFYTTSQVAETLGISPFTIRRYIRLRKLKAVKLEGSYRVRRRDLERFLKLREIETEEELAALENGDEEEDVSQPKLPPEMPPEPITDRPIRRKSAATPSPLTRRAKAKKQTGKKNK